MAEMKTSIVMQLVDRVTRPVRRITSSLSRVSRRAGLDRLAAQAWRVKVATGDAIINLGNLTRRLTYIGATAAGAAWGTERFVSSVADAGAELRNWSERLDADVQWLQQWIYTGRQFGVQQGAMIDGFKELSMRADEFLVAGSGEGADAFQRLGISPQELRKTQGSTEAIFDLVLSKIRDVENAAARQRIVDELFGGQAAEQMAELVGRPAEEIRRIMREGRESGAFFTKEDLEQSREYDRRMKEFRQTLRGIHVTVVGEILPGVTDWLSRMRDLTRANREAVSGKIVSGLRDFWTFLQRVGSVVSWVSRQVGGLDNLLIILSAVLAGRFLASLGMATIEVLRFAKIIITGGVSGIVKFSSVLIGLAVRAIPAAVVGIIAMTKATWGWGVALMATPVGWIVAGIAAIAGAAYLIYRNWGAISKWWGDMWSDIKGVVSDGVKWVQEHLSPSALLEMGKDWIGGLWNGIKAKWNQFTNWLSGKIRALTGWMPDWVKGKLGLSEIRAPGPQDGNLQSKMGAPAGAGNGTAARTEVGGELRIVVDSEGRPRVDKARQRGPMSMSVDSGILGMVP